jgi:hypothetical protein
MGWNRMGGGKGAFMIGHSLDIEHGIRMGDMIYDFHMLYYS